MQGRKINHEDENRSRGRRTTGTPEERRQKDLFSKEMQNYSDAVRGVRDEDDNKKRGYPYIPMPNSGNHNSNYGNPFENNTSNPQRHNSDYEDSYNGQSGNSKNNYQNNQSNDNPQGNPFDSNSGSPNNSYGGSQNRSNPTVFNPFAGMHAMYNSIRGVETFDPYVNEKLQKGIENVGANIRSGLMAPVRQIQGDVEESLSNGNRKSKEYQYVKALGGLGADLVVGFSMSAQNERYMDLINKGKLDGIKVSTMENAHKILYDVRSTINPEFKFDSYADLNRLRTQIDMTSTKAGYGAISRRSPENLKRLSKTIDGDIKALNEQINNLRTGRVIPKDFTGTSLSKEQINKKIEKLTKQVEYKGATKKLINAASEISGSGKTGLKFATNKRNIKSATKRLVLAPMTDTEVFRGYQTLHQTRMAVTTIAKATFAQYKGMYKIARYGGRLLKRPGLFVIRKVGVVAAHAAVATLGRERLVAMANSSVVSGTKQVVNAGAKVVNVGGKAINKVARAPGIVKSSISNGKVIISDRVRYGGKVVVRGAGRIIGRTPVGKLAVKLGRTKVGRGLKFGGKIIGKTVSFPVTATKFIARQIRKIVGKIVSLAMGAIGGIIIFGLCASIIASAAITAISTMMMVVDAVSDKYEDFVANTTMGATYSKLLEKEREFNDAISDLINEPIPSGYDGIKQWTNYNIHYIGPDGKEMFGSSAYSYGTTIGGVGGFDVVVNSTSDTIWTFLKKMGWNDYAIAGIMGNIMNECSMNPADGHNQAGRHDIGIVQWTGTRYTKFMNYANRNGGPYDINTQLKYLIIEEGYKNVVHTMGHSDWNDINGPTDYFIDNYEKYKNYKTDRLERQERRNAATTYYEYYTSRSNYADIEQDDDLIASIGSGSSSGDTTEMAANISSYSTSTIKGILSMAATYIDQDFSKYGSPVDGIFGDSIYKDYCAKLYDSTHIIGKDADPPQVYYCPAYSVEVSTDEPHVATESCNNKIPGGTSKDDWLNSGTGLERKFTLSITEDKDATYDKDGKTKHYTATSVEETGPHGSVTCTFYAHNAGAGDNAEEKRKELSDQGCKNIKSFLTWRDDSEIVYTYACACSLCKGHIDGNAYVFISNIYDPSSDTSSNNSADNANDNDQTANTTKESYDNIENKDVETRFSMYALDKYATAFDSGNSSSNSIIGTGTCTNVQCPGLTGTGTNEVSVKETADGKYVCAICGSDVENVRKIKTSDPGDEASVTAADQTENRAAEKSIMETLTGKNIEIKDWWKNENWFSNLTTTKTYFRLYSGEDSFDKLQKPATADENGFQNVVNKDNSTPYWFNAFTSKSGRNFEFEKHGWDDDSITRVRMLMAGDWLELYGIQDFGGVTGAPLTDEQLSQLINNTPEWTSLPSDRKAIVYTAQNFQENVAKRYNTRYVYGGGHGALKTIDNIGPGDTFDCSSYVCTILYNAGMYNGPCLDTTAFSKSAYFQPISYSELKPGDILVKAGKHVVLYMGGNKISHASTSSKPLKDTYNVEGLQYYMNQGFTAMRPTYVREYVYDINNDEN